MPGSQDQGAAFEGRVRELFDRALSLPLAEREPFVSRHAADVALRERVLELLRHGTAPPPHLAQPVAPALAPRPEQVQSTATDDLLQKLATSPKLDTNRFQLEGEIDRGGMGAILGIRDRHLNRRLAMKVMLEHAPPRDQEEQKLAHQVLGRFLEEAQVTSQLDHPGVVPVHELGLDQDGKVYFTMRLVKGRTASIIFGLARTQQQQWTTTRALEVILKVCDTMSYAHEKGVLHRDLKPSNVMVGRFGEVYVMDWGLAKVLGQQDRHDLRIKPESASTMSQLATARQRDAEGDSGSSVVSMDGQKLGTPSYMAPEQARSEALDVRADVYSIGAMVYELLTGRAPYATPGQRKPAYQILENVVDGPPKRIHEIAQGVPAELIAIVEKAMARDREHRYADTPALAADLRAYLSTQVVSAYRTGALVELKLWVRRNKPLAASLAAAVVILAAGIIGTTWFANQNAQLAADKTALASAETKAKEQFAGKVREFDQLAGVVLYERAIGNEQALYPPWPHKVAAMAAWLQDDAGKLLGMRDGIEQTVANLRARALPATAEEIEVDRRAHPRVGEWEKFSAKAISMRRAQDVRSGKVAFVEPDLPAELRGKTPDELNSVAWPLVDWEKADRPWGQEALALTCARAAFAQAEGEAKANLADTLAWALFFSGRDQEALAASRQGLELAPAVQKAAFEGYLKKLQEHVDAVAGEKGEAAVLAVESELAKLTSEVSVRRTFGFGDESQRFLHDALSELLAKLASLASDQVAGVEARRAWASQIQALSLSHPNARVSWAEVRAAIGKADDVVSSKLYAGQTIDLRDQDITGLVPIGMNPVTKLWEFYELRSAWDGKQDAKALAIPRHREDGTIEVTGDTGIVFVLLPGGTFTMGEQKGDPNGPNFDPGARNDETPHEVTLSPFFLSRYEMTNGQWKRLTKGEEPSWFRVGTKYTGNPDAVGYAHPVEQVDWEMSDRLMRRHGLLLPTEAQWEYGCRAGTSTAWWSGGSASDLVGCANVLDRTAERDYPQWGQQQGDFDDRRSGPGPVGWYRANAFGFHDTHGNVWEWCRDWFEDYGVAVRPSDGERMVGSPSGDRVYRGGSFGDPASNARSAIRNRSAPSVRSDVLGLRPSRTSRL